jgi:hypothetical protein
MEYVPTMQAVHTPLPVTPVAVEYVPRVHGTQPDTSKNCPAAQMIGTMMPGVKPTPVFVKERIEKTSKGVKALL